MTSLDTTSKRRLLHEKYREKKTMLRSRQQNAEDTATHFIVFFSVFWLRAEAEAEAEVGAVSGLMALG